MPFTLAHPAIVLPLAKGRRFSATALLAGSIVPDFEFFLQLREVDNIGHHWYGIALFDLPLGILFCYLFHNVLKQSLIPHLPPVYRRKCFHLLRFNWNRYAKANGVKVVLSLLLGIFSHLAWDSFTHHDGLFVRLMPWLAHSFTVASAKIPLYWWVQVVSSIVGMWWVYRFVSMQPAPNKPQIDAMANPHFWHSIALSWLTILAYRVLLLPQHNSFWGLVMAAIGSLAYAWLGISIIYSLLQLKNNNDGTD